MKLEGIRIRVSFEEPCSKGQAFHFERVEKLQRS